MEKPQKRVIEVYDFMVVTDYVNQKYNLGLSDHDIWHWFVDRYEPNNGSQYSFNTEVYKNDQDWVKSLKVALEKEFGKDIPIIAEW